MKATEILEVVNVLEEYLPIVKVVIPMLKEVGSDLRPVFEDLTDVAVDLKVRAITRYEKAGMTREEAILLTIDSSAAMTNALKNVKK